MMDGGKDLALLVERGEAQANEDMFRAAPRDLAETLGMAAFRIADATALVMPGADDTQFNRVFGLGLERPVRPEDLDEVVARYRPLGLSRARLQLTPAAQPADRLPGWLAERGLARQPGGATKRVRGTDTLPDVESDLAVIDAADAPGAFGRIACTAFGAPPIMAPWFDALVGRPDWCVFLAVDGGRPVSAGAVYLAEDCGWLGAGVTLPEARGRGGQGLMMRARVEAARAAGKPWAITETGAPLPGEGPGPSQRNMDRHGFVEVHLRVSYAI
jgi:GNAT superfamily N-acetyltransferase